MNQRNQIFLITAVALGLFVVIRLLPSASNVNHMDFRVEGKGALELCDPANPSSFRSWPSAPPWSWR